MTITVILCLLTIILPCYEDIGPQTNWLIILISILLTFILLYTALNGKLRLNIIDILCSCAVLYTLLQGSILNGINFTPIQYNYLYLFFLYVAFRCYGIFINNDSIIFITIISLGIPQSLFGILQYFNLLNSFNSYNTITGSFFNSGPYGIFLGVIHILSFTYLTKHFQATRIQHPDWDISCSPKIRNMQIRILYITVLLCYFLTLSVLLITLSRAAFVGVVFSYSLILMSSTKFQSTFRKYKKITGLSFLILFCVFGITLFLIKPVSANGRLYIWKISVIAISQNPIFGCGQGNFPRRFTQAQEQYFLNNKLTTKETLLAEPVKYAFNDYLNILTEKGFIGFLFFVAISGISICNLFRNKSIYRYATIVLFISAFFSYPFQVLPLQILFIAFLADKTNDTKLIIPLKKSVGILIISCIYCISWLCYCNYKQIIYHYKIWTQEKEFISLSRYEFRDSQTFKQHYKYLQYNAFFLYDYANFLYKKGEIDHALYISKVGAEKFNLSEFHNILGTIYQETEQLYEAESHFKRSLAITPNKLYPKFKLAMFYYDTGQYKKACETISYCLKAPIKIESEATRSMISQLAKIHEELQCNSINY